MIGPLLDSGPSPSILIDSAYYGEIQYWKWSYGLTLDCPCSGATLDKLVQPAILAALTEGPIHGYRLAERINEIVGMCGDKPDVLGHLPISEKDGGHRPM